MAYIDFDGVQSTVLSLIVAIVIILIDFTIEVHKKKVSRKNWCFVLYSEQILYIDLVFPLLILNK